MVGRLQREKHAKTFPRPCSGKHETRPSVKFSLVHHHAYVVACVWACVCVRALFELPEKGMQTTEGKMIMVMVNDDDDEATPLHSTPQLVQPNASSAEAAPAPAKLTSMPTVMNPRALASLHRHTATCRFNGSLEARPLHESTRMCMHEAPMTRTLKAHAGQ